MKKWINRLTDTELAFAIAVVIGFVTAIIGIWLPAEITLAVLVSAITYKELQK